MLSSDDLRQGRYLVLLDILGFRHWVRRGHTEDIYETVDRALQACNRWEHLNRFFKAIYYADTLLFYQGPPGYSHRGYLDAYALGGLLFSVLLANRIPARGAITFGELLVRTDSEARHTVVIGKAHLEAYEAQRKEKWLGITICPSAWQPFEGDDPGTIEALEREGRWRRREDSVLLLNPLMKLPGCFLADCAGEMTLPYEQWDTPDFPNDLRAFRFITEQAKHYAAHGDYSSRHAVKYHTTVAFFRDVLGDECFAWAERVSGKLPG